VGESGKYITGFAHCGRKWREVIFFTDTKQLNWHAASRGSRFRLV